MVRRALMLAAVLAVAGTAGCGGEDSGGGMPEDFALTFEHYDPTTPPPYHREWTIRVGADDAVQLAYVPDYSGDGVPVWRESFEAQPGEVEDLYADLEAAGALDGGEESDDAPIGGETERGEVTADGETTAIPAWDESGSSPLSPFADRIEALVPDATWRQLERRADAYAKRRGYES
jgi:hypothetical protein